MMARPKVQLTKRNLGQITHLGFRQPLPHRRDAAQVRHGHGGVEQHITSHVDRFFRIRP
jgi:hypothetical protein